MKHIYASFLFFLSVAATSRLTAPSGAIIVAKSGGDYETVSIPTCLQLSWRFSHDSTQISDAVDSLSTTTTSDQTIFIEEGTYNEQVYIPSLGGNLIIYGQTEE